MESKIESKLRLDFFLDQGLKLIEGDAVEYIHGTKFKITESPYLGGWNAVESCNKYYLIKYLAPRENKGAQPVGDDVVVDVVYFDGDTCTKKAGKLAWAPHGDYDEALSWKPNIDALIELQEKPKATQVKPEVDYWILYNGHYSCQVFDRNSIKHHMTRKHGNKVKIRPVYKKRDTHHSK